MAENTEALMRRKQANKETVKFGNYEWRVLEVSEGKALLLCEYVLEDREYNKTEKKITWEKCGLRTYLNGKFFKRFSESNRARIAETHIINSDNPNPDWGTDGGEDTQDHIFLLSISEAENYFADDSERIAYKLDGVASQWWLRSPGSAGHFAANIGGNGIIYASGYIYSDYGIRPALWLKL
jgi:hypothetical protein